LILKKQNKMDSANLSKPKKILEYLCDAERISSDGEKFLSPSGIFFYNARQQSNQFAHSGNYSIKLTRESPYGMTAIIDHVVAGEQFDISVWRKAKNNDAMLIVSSTKGNRYYNDECKVEIMDENGWELLRKRVYISQNWPNGEMKIYLWNTGKDTVYFDDLHIVREMKQAR